MKDVFDIVKNEVEKYNIEVKSSELIGLIPLSMIIQVGQKISPIENKSDVLQKLAFDYLGLKEIGEERILENILDEIRMQ